METSASELRASRASIAKRMEELIRKPKWTVAERSEFESLNEVAEQKRGRLDRLEGRNIDVERLKLRAFVKYLRRGYSYNPERGDGGISEDERKLLATPTEYRDMGEGHPPAGGGAYPGSASGFFVPLLFADKVEAALKFHSDMWQTSTIIPTQNGGLFPYPTANDSGASGELLADEGVQVTTQDVSPINTVVLGARTFSSRMIKCSIELAQDAWAGFPDYIAEQFAIRLARASTPFFTTGRGPSNVPPEPLGIMRSAVDAGVTVIGDDNSSSPDPTKEIGFGDLTSLEMSVDASYRRRGSWMMNSKTLAFFKKLKDKSGRVLYPSLADRSPDDATKMPSGTLNGYVVRINESMDDLAAGKKPILFGDLSKYVIRDVRQMTILRLTERFVDYGQIGFIAFARWDAALLDAGTHPVKYLTMAS